MDVNLAEARPWFMSRFPIAPGIEKLLRQCTRAQSAAGIDVKRGAELVTFDVDPEFHEVGVRWVSDTVGDNAMRELFGAYSHREDEVARLLCSLSRADERGAFGCAFESYAHLQLAKGGKFRTRKLGAGAEASQYLELESASTVWYALGQETQVPDKVRLCRRHLLCNRSSCCSACSDSAL
jgi:hypothetical protein